eukprot:6832204-Pyramimonas_sp.AAC.1
MVVVVEHLLRTQVEARARGRARATLHLRILALRSRHPVPIPRHTPSEKKEKGTPVGVVYRAHSPALGSLEDRPPVAYEVLGHPYPVSAAIQTCRTLLRNPTPYNPTTLQPYNLRP